MEKTLTEIAQELKNSPKKVQLIYAFNGTGKTRLSRAFKELVSPKHEEEEAQDGDTDIKTASNTKFALHPNAPAMQIFDDAFAYRKSETCSF